MVDISFLEDGVVDTSLEDGVVGNANTCGTCNETKNINEMNITCLTLLQH